MKRDGAILTILTVLASPMFACQTLQEDSILGSDLAAANPAFTALAPELVIGNAPIPGVARVFHASELSRIAQAHQITLTAPINDVCFERATEPLNAEKLMPVLKQALGIDGAEIEILDFSHFGVPHGTIAFTRAGLAGSGLWRGRVIYDENRSTPIWVKVRVRTEQSWLEAAAALEPGKAIDPARLVVRKGARSPLEKTPLASIKDLDGRVPIRTIRAGEPIFASMLVAAREIERGDVVAVEVSSGEAKLSFEAKAESAAHLGELVLIRNPENGRDFQARVVGKGKAVITR